VGELTLDSAMLLGHGAAGEQAHLQADRVVLTNSGAVALADADETSGAGTLEIDAGDIVLGAGEYALQGFADRNRASVRLVASGSITAEGKGTLVAQGSPIAGGEGEPDGTSVSSLTLTANRITGETGADLSVDAGMQNLLVQSSGSAPTDAPDSIGASIALSGGALSFGGRVALPSGRVSLTARAANETAPDGTSIAALAPRGRQRHRRLRRRARVRRSHRRCARGQRHACGTERRHRDRRCGERRRGSGRHGASRRRRRWRRGHALALGAAWPGPRERHDLGPGRRGRWPCRDPCTTTQRPSQTSLR
jgi:hypothetical protein